MTPGRTLVDLSMSITEDMPTNVPDHRPPTFERYATLDVDGWEGTICTIDTHCGTHVDAPSHFVADGAAVDAVDLAVLVGPASRIDVTHLTDADTATGAALDAAALPDELAPRLVVHTGWSDRAATDTQGYFTRSTHLSTAAAERLVAAGVRLVGIDAPSVDAPGEDAVHQVLLGAGVIVVENLANTAALPDTFDLTVLPLRLHGVDGSPARAVATVGGAA